MKLKIFTIAISALALTAFTPFFASEKDVIGTWKMDPKSIDKMVKVAIKKAIETNPAVEEQIEENKGVLIEAMQSIRLNIKADHTYETVTPQNSNGGKWAMANKDRVLEFTKADGTLRRDTILQSSATILKTINGQLKDTITFIHP